MPLFFCLAVRNALMAVQEQLLPSPSLMMSTRCQRRSGHVRSTSCWKKTCSPRLALDCTPKRYSNMELSKQVQVRSRRAWESWATKCGAPQGSKFGGLQCEFGRIPPSLHTREVGRRRSVVASRTVGTRPPMSVAALFPVCQSTVHARSARRASQPLGSVSEGHEWGVQATMATLLEGMFGDVSQQRVAEEGRAREWRELDQRARVESVEGRSAQRQEQENDDVPNKHMVWWKKKVWWIHIDDGPHLRTARGAWRAAEQQMICVANTGLEKSSNV